MSLRKNLQSYPKSPHKTLEKIASVLTVALGVAAFVTLLQTDSASLLFGVYDIAGTLLLVGLSAVSALLMWLQQYRYAQTTNKRYPLDERQLGQRLKIFYTSFFVVTVMFSFFVMALVTNSFDIMNRISTEGTAALTAFSIAWLCFAVPSILAAWEEKA
jgi:hypothetical protein